MREIIEANSIRASSRIVHGGTKCVIDVSYSLYFTSDVLYIWRHIYESCRAANVSHHASHLHHITHHAPRTMEHIALHPLFQQPFCLYELHGIMREILEHCPQYHQYQVFSIDHINDDVMQCVINQWERLIVCRMKHGAMVLGMLVHSQICNQCQKETFHLRDEKYWNHQCSFMFDFSIPRKWNFECLHLLMK